MERAQNSEASTQFLSGHLHKHRERTAQCQKKRPGSKENKETNDRVLTSLPLPSVRYYLQVMFGTFIGSETYNI